MKKVLFFLESLSGGGAEKVLTDIVRNLDQTKFDITVCTVSDEGIYQALVSGKVRYRALLRQSDFRHGGVRKIRYWLKTKMIYGLPARLVYKWLFRETYDVECAFIEGYATKLIAASPNPNSRKIAWVHTDMGRNPYAQKSYYSMEAHRKAYHRYDTVCCVSQSVAEVFKKMFMNDESVIVQYNPVDSVEVKQKGQEPIDLIPNSKLQLGTIGRLEQQKGFIRLVEVLGKLRTKYEDFSVWIVGEGSQRPAIEGLIAQYHLENHVKLLGFHNNPYKYMSKCDAFICSSYAEGFSTAATEALILGKPVFTTECAGMKELFGDEQCGEIVENTDEALENMLEKILSGEWLPESYLNAVSRRAEDFDIRKRMFEIEALLDA